MPSLTLRLSPIEKDVLQKIADFNGMTLSEYTRSALLEKVEDEYDVKLLIESLEENKKNPQTYSLEDVKRILNR